MAIERAGESQAQPVGVLGSVARPDVLVSRSLVVLLVANLLLDGDVHVAVGITTAGLALVHAAAKARRSRGLLQRAACAALLTAAAVMAISGVLLWQGADGIRIWHELAAVAMIVLGALHAWDRHRRRSRRRTASVVLASRQ